MRDGQVVKGIRFRDHQVVGDILELAGRYRDEGADELVFYDITASPEGRSVDRGWVNKVARVLDIPFCVAGGISSVAEAEAVLNAGAEKISVNSPALANPDLIDDLSARFGAQCVVVGIDSQTLPEGFRVYQFTGDPNRSRNSGRDTLAWVREVQDRGAGEIVLNCMASDGVRRGYDIEQLRAVRKVCRVPLIASGGAGAADHFRNAFEQAQVDAALAASVFHSGAIAIRDLKASLAGGRRRGKTMAMTSDPRDLTRLDFSKGDGLLPAIIQHADTGAVLMLGYMNAAALAATQARGRVVFFSRSRQRLWEKGESSGHTLNVETIRIDCDADTLLITARPLGPTCHEGTTTCFGEELLSGASRLGFLGAAERHHRATQPPGPAIQLHRKTAGWRPTAHCAESRRRRSGGWPWRASLRPTTRCCPNPRTCCFTCWCC